MARLQKQDVLARRDEKGELLPVEITLDNGVTVLVKPLTIGKQSKLKLTSNDPNDPANIQLGAQLIADHFVDPSFTVDELVNAGKAPYLAMLVEALTKASGASDDKKKV